MRFPGRPFNRVIFSVLLCLFSLPLIAETLKVGLGELDYPPFYYSEDERLQGVAVDIAYQLASETGHTLQFVRVPWTRLQAMLKQGSLDMVILYFKTEERAQDVIYTRQPHVYENSFLMVPSNSNLEYSGSLEALAEYDFFYVRGYSHGKEFDSADYLQKHTVNNENELLTRIASGRPFIGVGNKPALIHYARIAGLENKVRFLEPPIDRGANYMAFSKKRADAQELADAFSSAFERYAKSTSYLETLRKYGFAE